MDRVPRRLLAIVLLVLIAGCTGVATGSSLPTTATEPSAAESTVSAEPGITIEPGPTIAASATAAPQDSSAPGTPQATAVSATAGTASTGPGVTAWPKATARPTPKPTAVPSVPALVRPDLRYQLVNELGRPLFCDPDFYPVARFDEADQARRYLPAIRGDSPTYAAILAQLGIGADATPDDSQVLAIYREWKMLRALILTQVDGRFSFDYVAAAGTGDTSGWHVVGTIDAGGSIAVDRRDPSGPPPCPICLARGTLIATPEGWRAVENLRPGMPVWTSERSGRRVAGFVVEVGSTPVPVTHLVIHLVLSDGRTVDASPGHPLPDGRRLSDLRPGDVVDGAFVGSATLVSYDGAATFDLLPSGPTGTYWANGIRLASTLIVTRRNPAAE